MPSVGLSDLPVELFERVLEYLGILDILRLKLLHRRVYRVICCSNHIKYRIELLLAGLEDGNHYNLAERQQFLHSYQANWDSLTPQKTTTITVPDHRIYELAGGVYGLVPKSSPNSIRFYRLPSVSRGIEMEEWSIQDLDFSVDDFTMECAYDLLTAFVYKSGHVKVHLLRLSDGEPHPCAKKPLLEYEISLSPTERGWALEVVIWENRLGCLFTSALGNEYVDNLVVWDWTTGDLVRVLSQYGNHTFIFLNEDTIVAGRPMENASPSLSFFDLRSDEEPIVPYLTLALSDEEGDNGGSLRIRLNLGIPIHLGPELRVRVPFVVNPVQQMLLTLVFFVDPDNDTVVMSQHCIATPLSILRDWARAGGSRAEWDEWRRSSAPLIAGDPRRATFTMGSRFVAPVVDAAIEALVDAQPLLTAKIPIPLLVYNLSPHRRMRVGWESSQPHCQGISGVWNTVAPIRDNGGYCRTTQILAELSDVLMTEDSLIVVEMVPEDSAEQSLTVLSF